MTLDKRAEAVIEAMGKLKSESIKALTEERLYWLCFECYRILSICEKFKYMRHKQSRSGHRSASHIEAK